MTSHSLRTGLPMFKAAVRSYGEDGAGRMAAALSFYTLFSLVPMMFLVVAIAGFVLDDLERLNSVIDQVETAAGTIVADQIAELLDLATRQAGASLGIGIALTVFSASGIFLQVQGVLNKIFEVPSERTKGLVPLLWKRGVAFVSAVVLATLAITPVVAVATIQYVSEAFVPDSVDWLRIVLAWGVPIASLVLLVAIVGITFQTMTAVKIPWRAARRGGAATALIGLPAAYLVGLILGRIGTTGTLGALGGIAILLFFFNLMWQVYLLGAELTKVYADSLAPNTTPAVHQLSQKALETTSLHRPPVSGSLAGVFGILLGFLIGRRRVN